MLFDARSCRKLALWLLFALIMMLNPVASAADDWTLTFEFDKEAARPGESVVLKARLINTSEINQLNTMKSTGVSMSLPAN